MLLHQCGICLTCLIIISVINSRGWKILNGTASHHCHWLFVRETQFNHTHTYFVSQEHFPHLKASALVFPVPSAHRASPWWPLVLPLKTHNVNVTTATSFWATTGCVHLAPSAIVVRVLYRSVAHRETRSARSVAWEHFLRSILAPNPASPAPNVLTVRWRSEPACPTLTHSAWVSYQQEFDFKRTSLVFYIFKNQQNNNNFIQITKYLSLCSQSLT